MSEKKWLVVNEETQISHSAHETKEEAERVAKEMSEYHQKKYVIKERTC